MADQTPNIFPFIRFADADAALEWLAQTFGFQQRAVHRWTIDQYGIGGESSVARPRVYRTDGEVHNE